MSFLVLLLTVPVWLVFTGAWTEILLVKLMLIVGLNAGALIFLFNKEEKSPVSVYLFEGSVFLILLVWVFLGGSLLSGLAFKSVFCIGLFLNLLVPENLMRDTCIRGVFLWASSIWPESSHVWIFFMLLLIVSSIFNLSSSWQDWGAVLLLVFSSVVVFVVFIILIGQNLPIGPGAGGGSGGYPPNGDPNLLFWWINGTPEEDNSVSGIMFLSHNAVTNNVPLGITEILALDLPTGYTLGWNVGGGHWFNIPLTVSPLPNASYEAWVVTTETVHTIVFFRSAYFNAHPLVL